MGSGFMKIKQLIALAKEVGADNEEWFLGFIQKLVISWNESLYQKALDILMNMDQRPILDTRFPVPVSSDDLEAVNGPYKIGLVANTDIEFGLHPLQLQMHGVIGGGSGYGKSTVIKVLSQQIIAEGKTKIWLIDPKEGGDYRFLAKLSHDVVVLRSDVLKCNPFAHIKNVPLDTLREAVSDVTADSYGVYDASESILVEQIDMLLKTQEQPTIFDLVTAIGTVKGGYGGRKQGYLDSINSRLTKTVISLRDVINCRTDYFPKLYDKNVVFEVGDLSGGAQRFLVPWLIMKLMLYKIYNKTKGLSHLLVFDEAQSNLWSRHLEMRGRTSTMANLATQCRAFGLGILVLAQNPATQLMTAIIANSCIKLCLRLNSGEEIVPMSRHMGLTPQQMETFYEIDRGEAICRVGLGYFKPTHLQLYDYQDEPISNDKLNELMKPRLDKLLEGIEPAIINEPDQLDQKSIATNPVKEDVLEEESEKNKKEKVELRDGGAGGIPPAPVLGDDEQLYLRTVTAFPWRLVGEISSRVCDEAIVGNERLSVNRAVNARKKLVAKGYLETFTVSGSGRSGKSMCDIVTEKVGKVKHPRGGLLHSFWVNRIAEYYRKEEAEVKVGDTSTGSECDLGVKMGGKRIGVEVVISGVVIENVSRYVKEVLYDEMMILTIDEGKKKETEKLVRDWDESDLERVKIELLKGYFMSL